MESAPSSTNRTSVGLTGLIGFEQLERSRLGPEVLAFVLPVLCALVNLIVFALTSGGDDRPVGTTIYDGMLIFCATGFLTGTSLVQVVLVLRFVQFRFEDALPVESAVPEARERMAPDRLLYGVAAAAGALLVTMLMEYIITSNMTGLYDDPSGRAYIFLVVPVFGAASGLSLASMIHAVRYMVAVARKIPIVLVSIDRYQVMSLPFVIVVGILSLVLSVVGVLAMIGSDTFGPLFLMIALATVLVGLPLFGMFLYPLVIMRNRIGETIRTERQELQALILAPEAEAPALATRNASQSLRSDLLVHLMYIKSLNEWPIGPHIQKIILFGVMPPLAWILAAVVENTIY